jgi:FKBP-type peptidyl-prolyl cis-trans isomerase (trigger factor)
MRMTREMRVAELGGETADLLITVDEIRRSQYPDLDSDLVGEILGAQHQFAEDRAEARKRTEQIINRWAARQPAPGD